MNEFMGGLQLVGSGNPVAPAAVNFISEDAVLPDGSINEMSEGDTQTKGDAVASVVMDTFGYYHRARRNSQEDILLDCERAYNNKYDMKDQTELAKRRQESGDSTVWVPFTRTKVNIAVAKTYEKILSENNSAWSVLPDELTADEKAQNRNDVMYAQMSGALQEPPEEAITRMDQHTEKNKRDTCDLMELEIAEQMNKGKAAAVIAKAILQQHYLGCGVAKFEISVRKSDKWVKNPQGKWELTEEETPFPKLTFCSLFDTFFDPYAVTSSQPPDVIQRHVVKRSVLEGYKSLPGFDGDVIDQIITQHPSGNHIDLEYETTIRGVNDQDQTVSKSDNYYDIFEAWIEIGGDKLIESGFEGDISPTGAYKMNVWVCDNQTIKMMRNPHAPQRVPYFIIPYQENTHTIYGTGIPEELFGVQDVINSVTRATIDNAAFAHAPLTEINVSMLKSGETPPDVLKARHIFLREGGDPKEPMVRFYQPTENSKVLYNVYEMFSKIGEDATGISGSTEESLPAANTGNMGVSMSLSQKNILQRTIVGNIDTYLYKPMIEMYYNFNMVWNDRDDIKVPAKVTANGTTSIIAKEMRSQQLMAFAQITGTPEDRGIVNRKKVLEGLATSLDQDGEDLIYTDMEAAENSKQNQQAQAQAANAEQQSIVNQINAENQGEMQQEQLKGSIALRKQQLIEKSKMMQLAAKNEMDLSSSEVQFVQQLRIAQQNATNSNQSAILNSNLANQQNNQQTGAQQNANR